MNRCKYNPDCLRIQEEVLLEEGMFKMIGEPVLIKTENGKIINN